MLLIININYILTWERLKVVFSESGRLNCNDSTKLYISQNKGNSVLRKQGCHYEFYLISRFSDFSFKNFLVILLVNDDWIITIYFKMYTVLMCIHLVNIQLNFGFKSFC